MDNYNDLIFRASSMSDIMTGIAKGWSVDNSLTCKRMLVQIHRERTWKRKSSKGNKYTEKGTQVEPDAITLYSRVKKNVYIKNDERINNLFFTGEPDLFLGKSATDCEIIVDIKSSWSWETFPSMLDTESKDYHQQLQTYMALTGAKIGIVAHCLVNTPADLISDEKRKLAWKLGVIDQETPEYTELCKEIERNAIVDMGLFRKHYPFFEFHSDAEKWEHDIPKEERVHEIIIERDDAYIQKMQDRVIECRNWMNTKLLNNKEE